jgi:uncharacterized YigZ family protein
MYEVRNLSQHLVEVKQSKFISFLLPFDHLDQQLSFLKAEHPKARHFIVAWRKMNAYAQIEEYSTDDGEPKGTSGRPSLNVLRGENLMNTAVIVVRCFGGTKLGTGGLVRAYTDAVKSVVHHSELYEYKFKIDLAFEVSYSNKQRVEHYLGEELITIASTEYLDDRVVYHLRVTQDEKSSVEVYAVNKRLIEVLK